MFQVTVFKNIYDNRTDMSLKFQTYEEFESMLYHCSKMRGYKPKKEERFHPDASPLISPANYIPGTTRANKNVTHWTPIALMDVDDYSNGFDAALQTFSDYKFVCYSSASSTKEKPKFRVVLPLSRSLPADSIRHFWFSLSKEFNSLGDPQTKDLSRMYYVPARYPNAYNFIVSNNRSPVMDVDTLIKKYAYAKEQTPKTFMSALPDGVKRQIADYRKTQLTNTNFTWSGIHDCPFINRRLVDEYRSINETGWYRQMFRILLSTASCAMNKGYPISASQLAALGRELDMQTGGWYKDRPLESEAERAIAFACKCPI